MEQIKLICMDIDGTLLAKPGLPVSDENIAAMKKAASRGITLAISSGRESDDASFFALDTGIDMPVIALNGGSVLDRPLGNFIFSKRFSPKETAILHDFAENSGLLYGFFSDHMLRVNQPLETHFEYYWGSNFHRNGSRSDVRYGHHDMESVLRNGANKLLVFGNQDGSVMEKLKQRIKEALPDVEITSSWADNAEFTPANVHKGIAVGALADRLGIPMSQVMCIGDSSNDIPMIQAAGFGVAMGNSSADVFEAADYVTLCADRHGVAAAINQLALGESFCGVRKFSL